MLCGDLNEKEIQKRWNIHIRITDSFCCSVETNTHCKATILQLKKKLFKVYLNFTSQPAQFQLLHAIWGSSCPLWSSVATMESD